MRRQKRTRQKSLKKKKKKAKGTKINIVPNKEFKVMVIKLFSRVTN